MMKRMDRQFMAAACDWLMPDRVKQEPDYQHFYTPADIEAYLKDYEQFLRDSNEDEKRIEILLEKERLIDTAISMIPRELTRQSIQKADERERAAVYDRGRKHRTASRKALWAFYLLPARKYDDVIANLEDLREIRFLSLCGGDEKRADRVFFWQLSMTVFEHYKAKLVVVVCSIATLLGLGKLSSLLKGLLSG